MNGKKSKDLGVSIIISVAIVVFIVCLFLINVLYFKPRTEEIIKAIQSLEGEQSTAINNGSSFDQIKAKLLENPSFVSLTKFGSWPIILEKVIKEKKNPFIIKEQEEIQKENND